jgi:hypothetical protein
MQKPDRERFFGSAEPFRRDSAASLLSLVRIVRPVRHVNTASRGKRIPRVTWVKGLIWQK